MNENQDNQHTLLDPDAMYAELEKKAMSLIGRRVKISHRGAAKHISVSFEDNEDLEILLTKLCGNEIIE